MEKDTHAMNGVDLLQRIAGVSFIAGALIVIAANAAHPSPWSESPCDLSISRRCSGCLMV